MEVPNVEREGTEVTHPPALEGTLVKIASYSQGFVEPSSRFGVVAEPEIDNPQTSRATAREGKVAARS